MRARAWMVGLWLVLAGPASRAAAPGYPIIDVHLHADAADAEGPPPLTVCAPYETMPIRKAGATSDAYFAATFKAPPTCRHPLRSAPDDDSLRTRSLAMLRQYDVIGVASGPATLVARWRAADPKRIIPAIAFGMADAPSIEQLRALHKAGLLAVMGEIGAQYDGAGPDDPRLEPYWALAEELDIPVGIHVGPGPPGAPYLGAAAYRMALSDPLLLEGVLVRHPRLRLYVMHAGWPMADRMIALLYAHPQVYVDTGVIDWTQPRAEFHAYLKRLVDAGYGERVMFGSDQMVWPDAIPAAIEAIRSAPLTQAQKKAILHDNAVRFLKGRLP